MASASSLNLSAMVKKRTPKSVYESKLSRKEAIILYLMIQLNENKPIYALKLVEGSRGLLCEGTIYTTLSRMEKKKGYVRSTTEAKRESAIGLPRRFYTATKKGMEVFDYRIDFVKFVVGDGFRIVNIVEGFERILDSAFKGNIPDKLKRL